MTDFERAIGLLKLSEGGVVDHPTDPGGATNFGITLPILEEYRRANGLPKPAPIEIKSLTWPQAQAIYKQLFWDKMGCGALPWPACYAVFDYGVNSGRGDAIRDLQRIVGADPDGRWGPASTRALAVWWNNAMADYGQKPLEQLAADHLARTVNIYRLRDIQRIKVQNPKAYHTFIGGWINRMLNLLGMAL